MAGWIIRLYDHSGRLLYVATTSDERPAQRIRGLRSEMAWWGHVDETKTLTDRVGDPRTELALARKQELPKFFRDSQARFPYLAHQPPGSDYVRRLLASGPITRINARHGEH